MNLIPYFDKTSFGAYSGEIISIVLGRGYLNPDLTGLILTIHEKGKNAIQWFLWLAQNVKFKEDRYVGYGDYLRSWREELDGKL